MAELTGEVVPTSELGGEDRAQMFAIMERVYDGVSRTVFDEDLGTKDEVIVLRTSDGGVGGFSTQRFISLPEPAPASLRAGRFHSLPEPAPASLRAGQVEGPPQPTQHRITGIFSGDTVIAPEHWGSMVLFQTFARRYIIERDEPWYWFVICKGQRTYRILPTFFETYWPSRRWETPPEAQALMDAYATTLYPEDYNPATGVLEYRREKDRLRPGVAGLEEQSRNRDAAFFAARNPGHALGHDLVCLAGLTPSNIQRRHHDRLFGGR